MAREKDKSNRKRTRADSQPAEKHVLAVPTKLTVAAELVLQDSESKAVSTTIADKIGTELTAHL